MADLGDNLQQLFSDAVLNRWLAKLGALPTPGFSPARKLVVWTEQPDRGLFHLLDRCLDLDEDMITQISKTLAAGVADRRELITRLVSHLEARGVGSASPSYLAHSSADSEDLRLAGVALSAGLDAKGFLDDGRATAQRAARGPERQESESREYSLSTACERWQSGQGSGSTPRRAAARVLLGVPHYFAAGFIDEEEDLAARNREVLEDAVLLLKAIGGADWKLPDEHRGEHALGGSGPAYRYVKAKSDFDGQIHEKIRRPNATIQMPLWGVSLSEVAARKYGGEGGFVFRLQERFPGIAAWVHSKKDPHDEELITGGSYRVVHVEEVGPRTIVDLIQVSVSRIDLNSLRQGHPLLRDT